MNDKQNEVIDDNALASCFVLVVVGFIVFLVISLIGGLIESGVGLFILLCILIGVGIALTGWVVFRLLQKGHELCHSRLNVFFFFLFLPVFIPFWLIDRWALHKRAIHIRCPNCKVSDIRHPIRPIFLCPVCGERHDNLIPSPRGLFKRRCGGTIRVKIHKDVVPNDVVITVNADGSVFETKRAENNDDSFECMECAAKLATMFLGGRYKYEARCPRCDAPLYSTGARQYGIQLVGGIGSGKTTFIATFWQKYKELLQKKEILFRATPDDEIKKIEDLAQYNNVKPTEETNSRMLSIIHNFDAESVQASFYDVSGKYFETGTSETPQLQFGYCEGFLLFIDPTAQPDVALETTINFIDTYNAMTGKHPSQQSDVAVAVAIPKVDLAPFSKEFQSIKLRQTELRDRMCRAFLARHGYLGTLNIIDANFSNVGFFPVISTVTDKAHAAWKSFGVLETVSWLMSDERSPFNYGDERCVFLGTRYSMYEKM